MSRSKGKHLSKPNREFIEGGVRAGRSARDIAAARLKTSPPHSQPRVLALEHDLGGEFPAVAGRHDPPRASRRASQVLRVAHRSPSIKDLSSLMELLKTA